MDYIYNIINNSGSRVMQVKSTKGTAYLPVLARTPFANNYRYYKTFAEARNDAIYGETVAAASYNAVKYAENVNISTMSLTADANGKYQIYVRYDYNANSTIKDVNGQVLRIDGGVAYNMQINSRMVYYSTDTESYTTPQSVTGKVTTTVTPKASEPIRVTATKNINDVPDADCHSPSYLWRFIGTIAGYEGSLGHPDPYDVKIVNVGQYALDRTKVLTAVNTQALPLAPNKQAYLHLSYDTDGASATNVYRFFFRRKSSQIQVMAAKPFWVYNSESTTNYDGRWFCFNKEIDEPYWEKQQNNFGDPACLASLHMRLHDKQENENNDGGFPRAKTEYHPVNTHRYVILGDDGTTRASAYAPIDDAQELKVPDAIETIVPVTYSYYATEADANKKTNALSALPGVATTPIIYVRYDYDAANNPLVKLDGSARYTVAINGQYVKYDASGANDSHVVAGNTQEALSGSDSTYIWRTWGKDPYGIYVTNEAAGNDSYFTGTSTTGTIATGTSGKTAAVQKTDSYTGHTPGRYFLVKGSGYSLSNPVFLFRSVYNDANDNLYTWGYSGTDDWDGVCPRLFSNSAIADDNAALQMEIYELRDDNVTYHIIDKRGCEVVSASNKKVFLAVPEEIASPAVATYHYYPQSAFTINDGVYTLSDATKEINTRLTTDLNDVYVTYDVGDDLDLSAVAYNTTEGSNYGKYDDTTSQNKKKYMIRFLNGKDYYQEDGKDGLTDGTHWHSSSYFPETATKYKAEYAYVNGDGNLNVYCDFLRNKQFDNAANERTRWSWYIVGDHGSGQIDPYHITIQAGSNTSHTNKSKSSDANVNASYYASLRTYYNETLGAVVTSTISNDSIVRLYDAETWEKGSTAEKGGSNDNVATEYMILGQKGKYRLVTSQPIWDGTTTEHRTVNTLEQYWKNYDLIRKNYFKLDSLTLKGTTPLTVDQVAELEGRGWHNYKAWANAVPWDGMKENSGGKSKDKKYVYEDHWFQTFEVGEEFDLVELQPDPAVVLVDKHGWEVFRHPMPTTKNGDGDKDKAIFIKSYDSPMVTYHWYKKATKDTGCHRYALSDPAMTEDGSAEYTSESLLQFPPHYGQNAGDWYVNYEVKADYKYLYQYDGTSGYCAPVLIKQNDKWAKALCDPAIGGIDDSSIVIDYTDKENVKITGVESITNDVLWYLGPNTNIEVEFGYPNSRDTIAFNGDQLQFDPYNVQIKSAANSKYFKTAATDATLDNGQHWLATNPYNLTLGENTAVEFGDGKVTEGHDHTNVAITNSTFILIQDAHGDLRLTPRFDHESAVTNLTGGSPTVEDWIYDNKRSSVTFDSSTQQYTVTPYDTTTVSQTIELYPLQCYQFHVRDIEKGGAAADIATSDPFYAVAGTSLIHKLSNLTAPLPIALIRAYCEYQGAYTSYDSSTNTYSGQITSYPPGNENGIALTHIYVPYQTVSSAAFFDTEEEAMASTNWMFLMQGSESVSPVFGQKLTDYGMEVRYGYRDESKSEDIDKDIAGLTPAERSFPNEVNKFGGFHFLRRTGNMTLDTHTGQMTVPADEDDNVSSLMGDRYFQSIDSVKQVYLLSPLNDFRRIAETYTDGSDTGFRENSWLWAFIGDPYKFYAINREAGPTKRLAVTKIGTNRYVLKLTKNYEANLEADALQTFYFTMSKYADQTDEEAENTFALQIWDGDNDESNDYAISKDRTGSENERLFRTLKNIPNKSYDGRTYPDIAVMKVASFRAYPWNWSDTKYQAVTVNIYPGTEQNHGSLALTKTYTRADRAFIAGDVIDGTDGHFYLPIEGQEDGSWKPDGVVANDVPYDGHKINIPYELRRRYCNYTVEGGSFTVQEDDSENPTPQVLNIYYTVDDEHAPLFVSEDELSSFRQYVTSGTDATFKDGNKYSDYFYFLDLDWSMNKHLYTGGEKTGTSGGYRFTAPDPKQMMWYFVGDPYSVRLFNVYTDINTGESRNFVRHRYADKTHSSGFSDDAANDNKTFMELTSNKEFCWEMVDTYVGKVSGTGNAYEYSTANNSNAAYRLSALKDKPFALRMKMAGDNSKEVISNATYYYLQNDGSTAGTRLYDYEGNTLNPRLNSQLSYATYPDNRHSSNGTSATVTPLSPARILVTVYDPDEPTRKVTDNEVSEYCAVTDRFKGVPDNLQRKHCDYWWVSTDPDIKSENMVDENKYYTVDGKDLHLYVRYAETDDSPFSQLVDGVPVLKRDESLSPWYNMNINGWWAFFNSSLDGKTYAVNGTGAGVFNNSVLWLVHKGSTLPNSEEKFRKGLQWALVGDPYNFTLLNNRDRMASSSADSERQSSYLNQTAIASTGTTWTWIRKANTDNEFFLSESPTRRTVVEQTAAAAAPRRILPADYSISQQPQTRNFTVANQYGTASISTGDNYATGSKMWLLPVTESGANNESFDAIVNVYNKMNELVATTGWTELARNNEEWNAHISTEVQRWGCTYHYWADETMTRYPFRKLNQTDDGNPKSSTNNYLINDGGIVYVTYDYDESLYSSENEYRWVNLFFNWDDDHKEWKKEHKTNQPWYTAEYWEYNTSTHQFVKRFDDVKTQEYDIWEQHDLYVDTQEGWIESPATTEGNYDKDKAYAYYGDGQYTNATDAKKQKWAMIGDPYKFILYNYNRKAESGAKNSYYLAYDEVDIKNNNFTSYAPYNKDTYPGLYWTWKVDGTRYTFADGDAINGTTYGPRTGLPESFYKDYDGAETSSNEAVKKEGYSVETGYLALCAMNANSLYDKDNLVGSVLGYATFTHKNLLTTQLTDGTGEEAKLTYHTGTKEKFHTYNATHDNVNYSRDYTNDNTSIEITTTSTDAEGNEVSTTVTKTFTQLWRETYGSGDTNNDGIYDSGTYTGYYVGPVGDNTEGLKCDEYREFTTYKSVQAYDVADVAETSQNLTLDAQANLGNLETRRIPRFMVMPMAAQAKSITFHLQTDKYSDGTDTKSLRSADNIVFDHTSEKYGVGNTLALPWMMRRAYCDYEFYLVGEPADGALATHQNKIDDLTPADGSPSNIHRLDNRSGSDYTTFWANGSDLSQDANCYITQGEGDNAYHEYVVPQSWADKDVFILVKYKPTAEFEAMKSTSTDGSIGENSTVNWVNIMNVENGNMMRYTRSGNVTGENRDSLNDVTNDYLWAIEGDPYGFKLHSRYADHGFSGTLNENWSTILTTDKVNTTENYNYVDGLNDSGDPKNANFTYDINGDPVIKSGITYGAKGTADAFGTMSETATNAVYEAMTGNYDDAMLIHPVNACINIRNQNGYKYYGAFMFNGAPTGDPVQLNYMQDWEVMRNVYANWQFVKPAAKQFLPYYNRAGFVGGLKTDVAADADNKAIFEKIAAGTTLNDNEYNTVWSLVQNPANLVPFESGKFYRLKAYSAGNGVVGGDYVSGYLHKTELDGEKPLHIDGKAGVASNISSLLSYDGNEWAADVANKSLLEIPDVEFDPSSIFRVTRDGDGYVKMETQGLVVSDSKMMAVPDEPTPEQTESMLFQMQDIGLGAFQMRTKANVNGENAEKSYLSCNPSTLKYGLNTGADELSVASGISSGNTVKTHDTKWLLEPVGTTATNAAGNVYQHALKVKVSAMSDGYSYSTLCLPFNYTLSDDIIAQTGTTVPDESYAGSQHYHGTFELQNVTGSVKAGQPIIIKASTSAVTNGYIEVLLSADNPTVAVEDPVIKGVYLTQVLDELDNDAQKVFILGPKNKIAQFRVNAQKDYNNVANNLFVNHNKLYMVLTNEQASALSSGKAIEVDFDLDSLPTDIDNVEQTEQQDNGDIYDLQGRRVEHINRPGIYIRNGKKFVVRRGQY
ncbi:MAG: hypothetical protein J6N73_05365 [Prevotella sp.]|nr:hypothetical protein [Prevotella sp.]